MPRRRFLTSADLEGLDDGSELLLGADCELTDWAREEAERRGLRLKRAAAGAEVPTPRPPRPHLAIASDHGGWALKQALILWLRDQGYEVSDLGPENSSPVDYPDQALRVAEAVRSGQAAMGIMIDAAGIGSAMAANKVPGIRAALCYDRATARNSREHNHANLLTLGASLISPELARDIVWTWLTTTPAGGRHQARVEKITAIEQRFAR